MGTPKRPIEKMPDVLGDIVDHQQCGKCNKWFPLSSQFFHKNPWRRCGYHSWCKDCKHLYVVKRGGEEDTKKWFKKRAQSAKKRAEESGYTFSINYDDLSYPSHCPVSGLELDYTTYSGGYIQRLNCASLDRIDNSKGYTPENTRIVSWFYNRVKCNLSDEELHQLLKKIYDTCDLGRYNVDTELSPNG